MAVKTSRSYPNAGGYTYAEITIQGSVARPDGTVGRYSVPAVIIYPRHGRGNGVGVVDWLNSAFYHFFPRTTSSGPTSSRCTRRGTTSSRRGTPTSRSMEQGGHRDLRSHAPGDGQPHNHLVYGSIERSADAWEILLDAARLLKRPRPIRAAAAPRRWRRS